MCIWLIVVVAGMLVKKAGMRRVMSAIGLLLNILVNLAMICLASITVYGVIAGNYSWKSTDRLMRLILQENDCLAAHELGERKIVVAIPLLCETVRDTTKDINLRLNAAEALGKICSSSKAGNEHHETAMVCLIGTLKDTSDKEGFVRYKSAEALGKIGDKRALEPLRTAIENETDKYARSEMETALAKLMIPK